MNLAVFRGRRFVRYEVRPGPLADGHIRVPVRVPAQPPHVPSMHYLWSTCRLDDDEKGATIHYSVHDREQTEVGSEAPAPRPVIIDSPPAPAPPPVDDMSQRFDDLNAAVADMGTLALRQQQEIAELRSALNELRAAASADLADLRSAFAVLASAVSLLEVSDATGAVSSRKRDVDLILSEEAVEALKRLGIAVNKRKAA